MCGRYTLTRIDGLEPFFELDERPVLEARYNIAPTQEVPVVRQSGTARRLQLMRWGLVSGGEGSPLKQVINARRETLESRPMFREPFRRARCLIPADGFYEWAKGASGRQPHHFRVGTGELFAMAGLWRWWVDPQGKEIQTFSVVTTDANALVAPIHDRMPVIVPKECFRLWLDPQAPTPALKEVLVPFPAERMTSVAVSRLVNNVGNDSPECLLPAAPDTGPRQASLF